MNYWNNWWWKYHRKVLQNSGTISVQISRGDSGFSTKNTIQNPGQFRNSPTCLPLKLKWCKTLRSRNQVLLLYVLVFNDYLTNISVYAIVKSTSLRFSKSGSKSPVIHLRNATLLFLMCTKTASLSWSLQPLIFKPSFGCVGKAPNLKCQIRLASPLAIIS